MAKTKKTNKIDYKKVYNQFHYEMDSVMFNLFELKDKTFSGDITHKEIIESLFEICAEMNKSMESAEHNTYEVN